MSSLEIAELTGKRHDNVIRDIQAMLTELGVSASKFGCTYKDVQNKDRPCFKLPRREVEILITGYSTVLRAKVIDRLKVSTTPFRVLLTLRAGFLTLFKNHCP